MREHDVLRAITSGELGEAQRLVDALTPTTIADTIATVLPPDFPRLVARYLDPQRKFYDRIEIAPLETMLRTHGWASSRLDVLSDHLQFIRDALPKAKFASYVQAMATPAEGLQEYVNRITRLLWEPVEAAESPPRDRH